MSTGVYLLLDVLMSGICHAYFPGAGNIVRIFEKDSNPWEINLSGR